MNTENAPEEIKLKMAHDLLNQKLIKDYGCYLILHPEYGIFRLDYMAKEKIDYDIESSVDTESNWEKVANYYEATFNRSAITGVELEYVAATKRNEFPRDMWKIVIAVMGMSSDIVIRYHDETEIRELHKIFTKWWLNKD